MKKILHAQSRKILPESITLNTWSPIFIPLFFADPKQKRQIVWELHLENGDKIWGKVKKNALSLSKLPIGKHELFVTVGMPILSKKYRTYNCHIIVR